VINIAKVIDKDNNNLLVQTVLTRKGENTAISRSAEIIAVISILIL
jgi:hypothetical protein